MKPALTRSPRLHIMKNGVTYCRSPAEISLPVMRATGWRRGKTGRVVSIEELVLEHWMKCSGIAAPEAGRVAGQSVRGGC